LLIWVSGEGKYFCKGGWTVSQVICPVNQVICPSGKSGHMHQIVGWVEPFAKPIAVIQKMMGIASAPPILRAVATNASAASASTARIRSNLESLVAGMTASLIGAAS
jgi:hypothetical protein